MVAPVRKSVENTIARRHYMGYSLIEKGKTEGQKSEVVELGWGECR